MQTVSSSSSSDKSVEGTNTPPHVLVVDDEFLMRWSVTETLDADGCSVREAGDGETAMRAIVDPRWPVDVVVVDYHLPDTQSLELLSEMRRMRPECRIILMTADPDPDLTRRALALGARWVLSKPFEMSALESLVLGADRTRARA